MKIATWMMLLAVACLVLMAAPLQAVQTTAPERSETIGGDTVTNEVNPEQVERTIELARRLQWELGPTGSRASLRGLSAVDDQIVWASGSVATVLRSLDAGSSWTECGPTGFGELEFRSIHAFSATQACIASAGTPAIILRTEDAGQSWREVYRHGSEKAFLDALRFWDSERGMAFGDPIDGRLLIVETQDAGRTWLEAGRDLQPETLEGQAGFAASNSALALGPNGRAWIGTGGAELAASHIFTRDDWDAKWRRHTCPLPSGAAAGVFSITPTADTSRLVAVGGDYRAAATSERTACLSTDGGVTWKAAVRAPEAFRSAVVPISRPEALRPEALPIDSATPLGLFATGPTGSDYSLDGDVWVKFSGFGFHVLAVGADQVFAAGSDGRFAVLRFQNEE